MGKTKAIRIAGFVGAVCASAALIGGTAASTGAYFTDSHPGSITAQTGHLNVNVAGGDSALALNFSNLVPGEYQTKKIGYSTSSSTNEDLWLVFPTNQGYLAFTGDKDNPNYTPGGLGRYGHFAVANNGSARFSSYNLALPPAGVANCTDANGNGFGPQATGVSDTPPYCGVPQAIKLADNLPSGTSGEVEVTFGVTGRWTGQNLPVVNLGYQLVATQHGVRPDAPNF